jgi:hypothetical protein
MPRKPRTNRPVPLDWRPRSYWDHADPVAAIVVNVKGTVRRRILRKALEGSAPEPPVDPLLPDELSTEDRDAWGRFHPSCMGGEYLPGYLPGEVEIARIVYQSTLGDVVSLRAHRSADAQIHYRVVDDMELGEHTYSFSPQASIQPLSLGEVFQLLWTLQMSLDEGQPCMQATLRWALENADDPASYANFMTVESVFYPGLQELVAQRLSAFLNFLLQKSRNEETE